VIFHPPVLALLIGSLLASFMLVYAAFYAIAVLRNWDITSGSELQLSLERKTYLISALVGNTFAFQLLSLFLFVFIADDLSRLFVGAMCAAGSLNVNPYGYPALMLKMVNFLLAGNWLVLNHVDTKAYDYPLIKKKCLFLLLITPIMLAETGVLFLYFLNLQPDIITSCCSTIFSAAVSGSGEDMAVTPGVSRPVVFFALMALTILQGIYVCLRRGHGAYLFAILSAATFVTSIATLISVFSLYFYELPTHHCPFCILQSGYGYVGYPLYLSIFGGVTTGLGTGIIGFFSKIKSLTEIIPEVQRRLALVSIVCYTTFTGIIIVKMLTSNLIMEG
jgi:hypothetical protein